MTDVLGYDICGRKLRAGDEVHYIGFGRSDEVIPRGAVLLITGHGDEHPGWGRRVRTNYPNVKGLDGFALAPCNVIRKLTDDGRPATDAFQAWFRKHMNQIHREPNPAREREIEDAMPWTGGDE